MNRDEESDSASGPIETDLYFVGGVPAGILESDLSSFFSQFVSIDAITLRPSKSPASKGFAFLRTSVACDLISKTGTDPEMLGHTLSIEPAEDPKKKLLSLQNRALRKVFIGNVPQKMTSDQVLAAVLAIGPVERLTRFRVKSDRTKYCYAIMQHLEDATSMTNMKRLKVTDPSNQSADVVLSLGAFIPKSKQPLQFLESKYITGEPHQKTTGSSRLPFNESLGSKTEKIYNSKSNIEDPRFNNLGSPDHKTMLHPDSYRMKRLEIKAHETRPVNLPLRRLEVSKAGDLKLETRGRNADFQVLLRKNLVLTLDYRHEIANIRFNILLD